MENEENKIEVIVVGGGPAGIACAITIARAGKKVILIERGKFSGSKNVFGGAIYTQPTKEIFPDFEQNAPLERKNIEHKYAILGESDATVISHKKKTEDIVSYTVVRGKFDRWMADEAKKEEDETKIDASDPYWDFINTSFLSIDYSKLREKNKDIIGWVKVNSTNINYPVVQYSDNEYYLTHDLYKNYNGGGWVFLDYRNKNDFNNKNSIIYAHGRENKTMFGTLKNILNKEWYQNKDNYVIKTSSLSGSYVWQVFSVYKIPDTNDYIKTNFSTDSEYQTFLNLITKRSIYDFKTNVTINNKILTLSTCFDDNSKVVLHAKLIKSY